MKATLQAGLRHASKVEVSRDRTIDFMGEKGRDSVETICRAAHNRIVVDVAGTEKRLAAKAAKAGLA